MTFKFEINEQVLVSKHAGYVYGVVSGMSDFFGKKVTISERWITSTNEVWYRIKEYESKYKWNWPEQALEKIMNIATKEVKVDIKLETQGDCYKALLDGYILRSGVGMWAKLVDGVQKNNTDETVYCFDHPCNWEVFEEVEQQWFDNIPECGILCWVADSESSFYKREIDLITGYDPNRKTRKFHGTSGCSWQCAKPISKEELESLSFKTV